MMKMVTYCISLVNWAIRKGHLKHLPRLKRLGEDILVLDKGFSNLVVFKPTEFGKNVNEAVMHYNLGNDDEAANYWDKVLRLDANYEVAYVGIGKSLLIGWEKQRGNDLFQKWQ